MEQINANENAKAKPKANSKAKANANTYMSYNTELHEVQRNSELQFSASTCLSLENLFYHLYSIVMSM